MTKNFVQKYWSISVVVGAYLFGRWLDKGIDDGLRDYHNNSALFGGRQLKEGERVW